MKSEKAKKEENVYYFQAGDKLSAYHLSTRLCELINKKCGPRTTLIVLCIGTDRVTGDSLGPLIGYKLSRKFLPLYKVYGTLDTPVHALNLAETVEKIKKKHPDNCIIAIDASLGSRDHLGFVTLKNGPIQPGAGVRKTLTTVGDISITGIVNACGVLDHVALQTTRLSTVMTLADCISLGLQLTNHRQIDIYEEGFRLPNINLV